MRCRNLSSSNLNFSLLTLSMFLKYFGNELCNQSPCTVIAFSRRDCVGFMFVGYRITRCVPCLGTWKPLTVQGFELLVSVCLGRFMECRGVLPATQFAYRKGLGTYDVLFCVAHALESALEMGQLARILQIYYSAAFDSVNHRGFSSCSVLWKLEVQCCLFCHSMSWWMVVIANWLMWCRRCLREMFWALCCSSCRLEHFSLEWKTSFSVMLTIPLW